MGPMDAMMYPMEDEQRLKALADALRGRSQAADFYAMSTVPNLQRAAENEQKFIQGAAERQGVLTEALARRKQDAEEGRLDREQRAADREEDRALRLTLASLKDSGGMGNITAPKTFRNKETGETAEIGFADGVPFNFTTGQPMANLSGWEGITEMTEGQRAGRLEKLGTRSQIFNPLISSIKTLDAVLKPYDDEGYKVDDVPGMGFFEKGTGTIGTITRGAQDLISPGAPQGDVSSAIQAVMNYITRNQAGLAQTIPEIERIEREFGKDWATDPAVFVKAYPRLKLALNNSLTTLRATTPKEIVDIYKSNLQEGEYDITNVKFDNIKLDGTGKKKTDSAELDEKRKRLAQINALLGEPE